MEIFGELFKIPSFVLLNNMHNSKRQFFLFYTLHSPLSLSFTLSLSSTSSVYSTFT